MTSSNAAGDSGRQTPATQAVATEDFAAFFRDVHGVEPFPWQQRLTMRVLNQGTWPEVIDLPTGTGKTSVLDTAVFAMAAQPDVAPRRVVFVVDRRIVVDQVYERAQRLKSRIAAGETPTLRRVRYLLSTLTDSEPLGVVALRGGIPIDNEWTRRPDQPWVVVSTVDQFGSRLLFRGYGIKPGMRPIHAGLAGNDCLVILDEVHLSVPFAETLNQIASFRYGPLPHRFAVVEMSATPSKLNAERFTLYPATDLARSPELRQRVTAPKHAVLRSVRNEHSIPSAVLNILNSLNRSNRGSEHDIRSVGVIVNRVRTAREVHKKLVDVNYSTHLITGRMRPLDRVDSLRRIGPVVDPDSSERGNNLTVVVSTQAIEVGADFSFDALITECAPIDSLRQRFGRLDRRGSYSVRTGRATEAWIIGVKSVVGTRPDPIYGNSVKATWEELQRRAKRGPLEVGPMGLQDFPAGASAPRDQAPLVLRTHLEAWAQTSPEPIVQPSIESFLHGMNHRCPADVSIVWRRDTSSEVLRLVPPRQAEFLQVPIGAVRSWLSGAEETEVADVPQTDDSNGLPASPHSASGKFVRWGGAAQGAERIDIQDIRPGDVLIAELELGGLSAGTWDPSCKAPVSDLGDEAQHAYGRRLTLRLDPHLSYVNSPPVPAKEAAAEQALSERIAEWLENWTKDADGPIWIHDIGSRLGRGCQITPIGLEDDHSDGGYYVLIEHHAATKKPLVDSETMDGSDESDSLTGTGMTLRSHLDGVSERTKTIAERLGLPDSIRNDLSIAGRLHDLGKVDRRFQLQMVGGDPIDLEMHEQPLAKSLPGAPRVQRYPSGMRHELASVALIESNEAVLSNANDKDLVLHLIATHHGWARPLPPIINDRAQECLSFQLDGHEMIASSNLSQSSMAIEMADRFWRLVKRYGYYGLAWLEAILRLADHQQSAEESKR